MAVAELNWRSMTAAVNEMKAPNQFVKRLSFGRVEAKPTENIEISVLNHARKVAPFVKRNGEAIMVEGHSADFFNAIPPNIRIKRPFTPSDLLFTRRPESMIFQQGTAGITSAIRQHIGRDLQSMEDDVVNAEEFLCAKMLADGVITYTVAGGDSFTIDVQRPAANNITSALPWSTPATADLAADWKRAKRIISDAVGLGVTHCVLGLAASDAFTAAIAAAGSQALLDHRRVVSGSVDFTTQFNEDGAIFLGMFQGTAVWEYSRTVDLNGSAEALIGTNDAIFFNNTSSAQNVLYYGAIPDIKTLQGRFMGTRFSKSWETEDPSVLWALVASRPLPISRRPGSVVKMTVVV